MTISGKGEAEMKKDKEWAFIELGKLFPSHAEMHDFPDDTTVMKCELLNKVYDILKQLDEPEVVSPEWIEDNTWNNDHIWRPFVYVDDLQNLLLPKQEITEEQAIEYLRERNMIVIEKPTIPQFIADWIEKSRNKGYNIRNIFQKTPKNVEKWLYSKDSNEKIVRLGLAYLLDEYEVEKEQRYYAKIKGHENIDSDDKYWNYCVTDGTLDIGDNKVHDDVLYEYVLSATKYDWNILGINDDNADFVEVEELEE